MLSKTIFIFQALILSTSISAQSGGSYEIKKSVISNGGTTTASEQFSVTGTVGQSTAGATSANAPLSLRSGFWQSDVSTTASLASVSGRVTTSNGNGIRGVRVSLIDTSGTTRNLTTSAFGYFSFENVEVGQTYILLVQGKRFQFAEPSRVLVVSDNIDDLVFTAEPLD